ncbi:MAG: hypothetical protein M1540_08145 [Candidatus Bathyarchaeota archaeon]|nr:hypothetical protein [Candidatus Bathyarchaeota archaeon]
MVKHQNGSEAVSLSNRSVPPTFRGRSLGITTLVAVQLLIGVIHVFFGALLFVFEDFSILPITVAYDVYTLVYGLLVLVFAVLLWQGKKAGWIGTVAVSLFVIAADSLTLLDLPSIPGIPKAPAIAEIAYSVVVIGYLIQLYVRKRFCFGDLNSNMAKTQGSSQETTPI